MFQGHFSRLTGLEGRAISRHSRGGPELFGIKREPSLEGRATARAEDAQGTPTQSHISPRILVYEENFHSTKLECIALPLPTEKETI